MMYINSSDETEKKCAEKISNIGFLNDIQENNLKDQFCTVDEKSCNVVSEISTVCMKSCDHESNVNMCQNVTQIGKRISGTNVHDSNFAKCQNVVSVV